MTTNCIYVSKHMSKYEDCIHWILFA